MAEAAESGVIQRGWNTWIRFWFGPADPTPLCLMRIVAGLLTLYVHIAYSFDLVAFFGADGWYDHAESNLTRRDVPHVRVRNDWKDEEYQFRMPLDKRQRTVLRSFMAKIIATPDEDNILFFMHSLGLAGEERDELLRYIQAFPPDKAELNAMLQAYVDDKLPAEDKNILPRFLQHQVTPESRQNFVAELKRFNDLLPTDRDDRTIIVRLLLETTPIDWQALQDFVRHLQTMSPGAREEYLTFRENWGIPPEWAYTRGMAVYSPWFHVTDNRVLWLVHGLHLLAILSFTVGWNTRVSAVLTWLAGLSYIHRAQPYLFGQDTMMNLSLFYLMMSPCGARWSIDRWMVLSRAKAEGKSPPPVTPSVSAGFVLRLLQIQYCLMYISAGCSKLKGSSWWNGTAMFGCMANPEFSPMHLKVYRNFLHWLCAHRREWEIFNTGSAAFTIFTEISFPFCVWTRMRPVVISAAILMHTGIALLMGLTVFSLFMFSMLLCFFSPATINSMFGTADECQIKM